MEPKKLYTNFSYTSKMNKEESPPCNHFSLRGYVAEMHQKDLNICLAFPAKGSETRPTLPPLVVQRFRSWSCNVCLGQNEFSMDDQSDQSTCCEGTQETLTRKSVPARKEIDINKIIDLTGDSDDSESDRMSINEEERNDAEVSINEITGNSEKNGENENEIQDLHQKKSSKKFKRMRLLREILREDDEPVAEQIRRERPVQALENPSNNSGDSQRQKIIMEKVVGEGDTKKLEKNSQKEMKRKLVLDEDDAPLTDFIQRVGNQVTNEEGLEEGLHLSSNSSPQETDEARREQNEVEALDALLQISKINIANVEAEPEPEINELKGLDFDLNLPHHCHMLSENIGLGICIDLNVAAEGIDPDEKEEETQTQQCGGIGATLVSLNNNISERFCRTNRNPADFSPIAAWNPYMREKKDKVPKEVTGKDAAFHIPDRTRSPT